MTASVVLMVYRCEVAGVPTESLDFQVRYFASGDASEIDRRLREESPHSYANDRGETVTWPLARILAIEPFDGPGDGAEIAGFITGLGEFAKWARVGRQPVRDNEPMSSNPQSSQPSSLEAFLITHRIEAFRQEHPPVMTVAESEQLVPPLPGAKTKNLFLRDKKGLKHLLVSVPHDLAVDLDQLGMLIGVGRLGFASADRLMKHLGVTPGSVSLLALVNDSAHAVELVIDRRLWEAEAVHAHPLVNTATLVIRHAELERFLAATGHAARIVEVPGRSA
jgi:Ala-tRNA(Pro) deacylase